MIFDEAKILSEDLLSDSKFFTTARDHKTRLKDGFMKGKQPGETSYIEPLNDIFTIRKGFLYCFTGWPGSGKSEFINQLSVLQAFFNQRKVAFYSPESYPVDEFIDMLIHCYLGKSTDKRFPNVCSEQEYEEAIEWVDKYFYFCDWEDTPDSEKLLNAFTYLHKEKGVEIFVVDPFNSLNTDGEDRNIAVALKKNLTSFKRFASQKRVVVWLVEHPKTPSDVNEFDRIPDNRSLFGGTMWWNKLDVGVSVHRPNRQDHHDPSVMIKTWKIKKQELNGRPGDQTLYFKIQTKRYYYDIGCTEHPMNHKDLYSINDIQPF